MKKKMLVVGICSLFGAVACSSGSDPDVDIGDAGVHGEKLSDYADVWEGYTEAFQVSDGSDKVRIVLNQNGEGTIQFGEAAAPSLDPAHPPRGAQRELVPGFAYAVRFAEVASNRLRFRFDEGEALGDWCAAQTSYAWGSEAYGCIPNAGFSWAGSECFLNDDVGGQVPIDCRALDVCMLNVCQCTQAGCAMPEPSQASPTQFAVDGALDATGDQLEGTLSLGEERGQSPTLRLTRQ